MIEKKVESLVISNEENCKRIIEMEVVCKDLYLKVNDLIDKVITFSINTRVAVHFFFFLKFSLVVAINLLEHSGII